jgi:hypothetical protein
MFVLACFGTGVDLPRFRITARGPEMPCAGGRTRFGTDSASLNMPGIMRARHTNQRRPALYWLWRRWCGLERHLVNRTDKGPVPVEATLLAFKNERAEIEKDIMKYRALARGARDRLTNERINVLVAELEQKLREITL